MIIPNNTPFFEYLHVLKNSELKDKHGNCQGFRLLDWIMCTKPVTISIYFHVWECLVKIT